MSDNTPAPALPARPKANPAALGLGAFAMTTFVAMTVDAGWFNADLAPTVLGLAIFYGGMGQLVAGLWEFANGNTFGGAGFSSYGGFWLSYWYLNTFTKLGSDAHLGVGIYLIAWGIFTLYMTVATLRTTVVLFVIFALLTLTFIVLGIAEFANSKGITIVGGYIGLLTALSAWYGSFAIVVNDTWGKDAIPMWPIGQS